MYSLAAVYSLLNISIASARAEDLDSDQKLRQNDHMSCFPTNPMPSSRVTHANPLLCHPVRAPAQDLRFDLWNGRVCFFSSTLQRTSPWSRKLYERRYFQITARLTRWVSQRPRPRLGVFFCESCLLSHEKNGILLKEESFPAAVRYNELDFQCRHTQSKAGRKKSNPIITAIVIGFLRWFRAIFSGMPRVSGRFLQNKYPLAISYDHSRCSMKVR